MNKQTEAAKRYRDKHRAEVNERSRVASQARRDAEPRKPCECGCGEPARRRFVPGHNMKAPDDGLTRAQRTYRKNRKKRLADSNAYGREHREHRCKYLREYYYKDRKAQIAKRRAYALAHPEQERKRKREWTRANPERNALVKKLWRIRNPDSYKASVANTNHRRRAMGVGPGVSPAEWRSIRENYGFRCAYCGTLRKQFTQDHIVPLSAGGGHSPDNVVPARARCNTSKGARSILVWLAYCGTPRAA